MNNLYHKVAFASVCTALSFAWVANKEAKAAEFTLTPTIAYTLLERKDQDGLADYTIFGDESLYTGVHLGGDEYSYEYRVLYEFNLANLSLASTAISSAILGFKATTTSYRRPPHGLYAYGYIGNGKTDVSDFEGEEYLGRRAGYFLDFDSSSENISKIFDFNVLPFISQRIKNKDTFVGFSLLNDENAVTLNKDARLTITTVDAAEPVPEPTTLFGSALALSVGGWLKRKKSSQQNKRTPQH